MSEKHPLSECEPVKAGEHTPGPWHVVKVGKDYTIRYTDGDYVSYVARIFDIQLYEEHGTADANARLIAAAPDLLAACEGIRSCPTEHTPDGTVHVIVADFEKLMAVCNAIARAKGE